MEKNGEWNTTRHQHKGRLIVILSRKNHGMKAHIFNTSGSKVEKTLRFNFIQPDDLLAKCKDWIAKQSKIKSES